MKVTKVGVETTNFRISFTEDGFARIENKEGDGFIASEEHFEKMLTYLLTNAKDIVFNDDKGE